MAPTTRTTEHKPSAERIIELDGLRGLAILLVVLCHYITAVPHGRSHSLGSMAGTAMGLAASGVDLFFILSGFLIGGILLDSTESPNYYRTFYLRRFYRIFPVYYLWIGLFALISTVNTQFRLQTPYWVFLAFLQNYSRHRTAVEVMWFGVMWSLGVEEQFYLLAPPLIHNTTQHNTTQHNTTQHNTTQHRHLTRILLGVLAFSFILRLVLAGLFGNAAHDYWGLSAATFWMPCRADDLALGVLAALAWRNESQRQWVASHLAYFKYAVVLCAALLLTMLPWMARPLYFIASTVGIPAFSVLYLSMLVIALLDKQSLIVGVCRWRVLRELGKISYCVYIIHIAVNWAAHKYVLRELPRFDSWRSIGVTVLAAVVTLMIGEISWFLYERPLIRRGHRYSY